MKKIMILALGAAGLLGLSACGTNTTILKQNNEPVVLKGQEGLQKLNEASKNASNIDINQFNEVFFDTDIDFIKLEYSDSKYLGLIELDEEYDESYYAYYDFNTELYGYSRTYIGGLLGEKEDLTYGKETVLCAITDVDVNIPLLGYRDTYDLASDDIEVYEYYQNGEYSFDMSSSTLGEIIEYINSLFGYTFEPVSFPFIPGVGEFSYSIGDNNLHVEGTNIPTSGGLLLSDEEKEQIQEFFDAYPELVKEYFEDTLSDVFTVTFGEDFTILDVHLYEDLIYYVANFIEEYVGVSIDVEEYIPQFFDLNLTILFDENMIPTYCDCYAHFVFEIPGYDSKVTWTSRSTTDIYHANSQLASNLGMKIEVIEPTKPDDDDNDGVTAL